MTRSKSTPRSTFRSLLRITLLLAAGVLVGVLFGVWRAVSYEPDFYRDALAVADYRKAAESEELKTEVRELQERVQKEPTWETEYTDEQVNAWLAVELPREYPQFLPPELADPRVSIDSERIRVAGRYVGGKISAVVSIELQVGLGESPNELELRIRRARAGAIPVPLEKWIEEARKAARRSNAPVEISLDDQTPVVRWKVPQKSSAWPGRKLVVERVELSDGKLKVKGRSEPE